MLWITSVTLEVVVSSRARRQSTSIALLAVAALALAACSPGGSTPAAPASGAAQIDSPVTGGQVAALGKVTLKAWADSGETATLQDYVKTYEVQYPNVHVQLTIKGFDDLVKTLVNAMNSDA